MPLCESIVILVTEIESQLIDINGAEAVRINALKNMPKYLADMRLDLFDTEFKSGYLDDEDENRLSYKSLEIIAGLAYENMYVEFSLKDSMATYKQVIKELHKFNISISKKLDMSGW